MERREDEGMSPKDVNEMEDRRIARLDEADIDEALVLSQSEDRANNWQSYFNENIVRGKDDMNFVLRDQWTAVERSEFTRLFKPAMTFNKLYDSTKKIAGEQRKNKPDLLVRSITGKATPQQIDLRADLVRTISYQSQNDLVYQTAFRSSLMMGFGAFQICLDYESPRSFNQIIRYEIIPDAVCASFDPTALKPHKGDGNYCSRDFYMSREEFDATYPYITNPISVIDPYMLADFQGQEKDGVRFRDYFAKEWFPLKIYKLSNKMSVTADEWKEMQKMYKRQLEITSGAEVRAIIEKNIPKVVNERQTQDYRVIHYRHLQNQIMDFSEWPSRHLPIIFVDGDSYFLEGKQYTKSFIHEARDAQKLLNYARSETASELKNRRREQWIGTPDNVIGYEQMWRNPELQNGILLAKPDPKTGQMPTKMPAWEVSQGLFMTAQSAGQDMKEVLGFSEAEELQSRDISGKARRERKLEGSMSAYVFFDNLNQAIEQGGRVVLDLLPSVIGEDERHMVVSKANGQTDSIVLNKINEDGEMENVIEKGDYDIEIDTGPSFAVQKDIALEFLQQTIAAYPQAFPLIADLWAKNLDVQFMPQIAERFKSIVPPQILAKEEGKQLPPQPPSMQEQMMQQEMEIKKAQLAERAEELQIRKEKHDLERAELIMNAKELMAKMDVDTKDQHVQMAKADMDFSAKIVKILADLHKDGKKSKE